jgi:hypothetical protein
MDIGIIKRVSKKIVIYFVDVKPEDKNDFQKMRQTTKK